MEDYFRGIKSLNDNLYPQLLENYFTTVNRICEYFEKTGLAEIFRKKEIKNLVDYVFGVEVGLDTNARKNRGGHNMENAVAKAFEDANIPFRKEVNSTDFKEVESLGEDLKRFGFVIETPKMTSLTGLSNFVEEIKNKLLK